MKLITIPTFSQTIKSVTFDMNAIDTIVAVDIDGREWTTQERIATKIKTKRSDIIINKPYQEVLQVLSQFVRIENIEPQPSK